MDCLDNLNACASQLRSPVILLQAEMGFKRREQRTLLGRVNAVRPAGDQAADYGRGTPYGELGNAATAQHFRGGMMHDIIQVLTGRGIRRPICAGITRSTKRRDAFLYTWRSLIALPFGDFFTSSGFRQSA
jgi:hypothetical protein